MLYSDGTPNCPLSLLSCCEMQHSEKETPIESKKQFNIPTVKIMTNLKDSIKSHFRSVCHEDDRIPVNWGGWSIFQFSSLSLFQS